MNTADFLRLVWPERGPYLIGFPMSFVNDENERITYLKQFSHDSIDQAAIRAQDVAWDGEAKKDVYFALGSVSDGTLRKGVRKFPNIARLKCYWLDLDVGADPGKYATRKEALVGLQAFCKRCSLPKPYLVSSGFGVHAYWVLEQSVDRDTWVQTALLLKAATKEVGLRADPSRTADCASVLRPVGTANWKSGKPVPVELMAHGKVTTQEQVAKCVAFAYDAAQQQAPVSKGLQLPGQAPVSAQIKGSKINDSVEVGGKAPPSNPKRVIKRCRQLTAQLKSPGMVSEPSWYAMVGCLRHCASGEKAVHFMSHRYPSYSKTNTDSKIAHHIESGAGPTLCSTFEDHNPSGCDGCPHRGAIRSPIVLGHEFDKADAPPTTPAHVTGELAIAIPDPPYPYQRVKHPATGEIQVAVSLPSEDGEPIQEVIYEYDLYPSKITYDERENKYKATMRRLLPKDGWGEFEFPLGDLFDKRSLAKLLGNIGVLPDTGHVDALVQYMNGYLKELQKLTAAAVMYAQLGWREQGSQFILPDRVITQAGERIVRPSSNIDNALGWDKHPPQLPGVEALQFTFGVGFAAPLFQFTPYAGMVVSAIGKSGCGKSTATMCANSIWGHPRMGWGDMRNDTIRAFYNKLGVLRHLPATFDEITNLPPEDVSDLCYAVSKGQGRQRLEQDGSAKANHGDWCTMMITTSNSSLHSKLAASKADASAETVRVFEYYVPEGVMTKQEADSYFNAVDTNFGQAGPVYAAGLVKHRGWVQRRVAAWSAQLDSTAHIASSERFWSAGAACVLAGFELANKLELTNASLERLFNFSVSTINRMRSAVQENIRTPTGILSDYLNGNLRNTLIVSSLPEGSKTAMVTHAPTGELRVRYEVWKSLLYIDRAHFRRYCERQGLDVYQVRRALSADRILVSASSRLVLGRNTPFQSSQTNVWAIDMAHPAMGAKAAQLVASDGASCAPANDEDQEEQV